MSARWFCATVRADTGVCPYTKTSPFMVRTKLDFCACRYGVTQEEIAPRRGKISQPRDSALGDGVTQKEIAACRGRIIKCVVKVLPFLGDKGVLPTQPRALFWAVWCWPCRPILCLRVGSQISRLRRCRNIRNPRSTDLGTGAT